MRAGEAEYGALHRVRDRTYPCYMFEKSRFDSPDPRLEPAGDASEYRGSSERPFDFRGRQIPADD